jgi:hypothetical protein
MKTIALYNKNGEHVLSLIDKHDNYVNYVTDICRPDGTILYFGIDKGISQIFADEFHINEECFYFTFGVDHFHKKDIVKIYGDVDSTRKVMLRLFGNNWSLQYTKEEGEKQIKKYGYNIIEIER